MPSMRALRECRRAHRTCGSHSATQPETSSRRSAGVLRSASPNALSSSRMHPSRERVRRRAQLSRSAVSRTHPPSSSVCSASGRSRTPAACAHCPLAAPTALSAGGRSRPLPSSRIPPGLPDAPGAPSASPLDSRRAITASAGFAARSQRRWARSTQPIRSRQARAGQPLSSRSTDSSVSARQLRSCSVRNPWHLNVGSASALQPDSESSAREADVTVGALSPAAPNASTLCSAGKPATSSASAPSESEWHIDASTARRRTQPITSCATVSSPTVGQTHSSALSSCAQAPSAARRPASLTRSHWRSPMRRRPGQPAARMDRPRSDTDEPLTSTSVKRGQPAATAHTPKSEMLAPFHAALSSHSAAQLAPTAQRPRSVTRQFSSESLVRFGNACAAAAMPESRTATAPSSESDLSWLPHSRASATTQPSLTPAPTSATASRPGQRQRTRAASTVLAATVAARSAPRALLPSVRSRRSLTSCSEWHSSAAASSSSGRAFSCTGGAVGSSSPSSSFITVTGATGC
mmetsp:Transcript_43884/g.103083  ORF Transcript_43884/g.103083 Transcript_43884/m.103083 type:complete len:522 (+) Transcript_43884:138-1703(+)